MYSYIFFLPSSSFVFCRRSRRLELIWTDDFFFSFIREFSSSFSLFRLLCWWGWILAVFVFYLLWDSACLFRKFSFPRSSNILGISFLDCFRATELIFRSCLRRFSEDFLCSSGEGVVEATGIGVGMLFLKVASLSNMISTAVMLSIDFFLIDSFKTAETAAPRNYPSELTYLSVLQIASLTSSFSSLSKIPSQPSSTKSCYSGRISKLVISGSLISTPGSPSYFSSLAWISPIALDTESLPGLTRKGPGMDMPDLVVIIDW